MPASKPEQVLQAIKVVFEAIPDAVVDAVARDTVFDELLQQIGVVLEANPTLGGLVFGLTYGRPETSIEAVAGAPAIKSATLTVTVDYETDTPLS